MHFTDYFRCTSDAPIWMRYVSLYSNNAAMRDALRRQIATAAAALPSASSQVVQRVLAHLPLAPQVCIRRARRLHEGLRVDVRSYGFIMQA
jgi:hypothetical protein